MSSQTVPSLLLIVAIMHIIGSLADSPAAAVGDGKGGVGGGGGTSGDLVMEFYIHDITGGSNPTARPITGLLGNIYNGEVPFARPIGFYAPKNGVPIPNADGALPTINSKSGIPLGTGLTATTSSKGVAQAQAQLGPDGLGLGFGTITVIDDVVTAGPDHGSQRIGKAQGVYIAASGDGTTQLMAFTTMMEGGEYGDTLNLFGVYKIGTNMCRLSVTGGTGKFKGTRGTAEIRPLFPSGQLTTDGVEALLRITVHLKY